VHTATIYTVLVHIATSCALFVCITADHIVLVRTAVICTMLVICCHLCIWLSLLYLKDSSHGQLCAT